MDERKQSLVAALGAKVLEIGYIQSSRPVRNAWWERRPQSVEWQGLKPTQGFFQGKIRCVLQVSILGWMVARDQCQLKLLPIVTRGYHRCRSIEWRCVYVGVLKSLYTRSYARHLFQRRSLTGGDCRN